MPPTIDILVPQTMVTDGGGMVSFTIEIHGNHYREYRRTCRIDNVPGSAEGHSAGEFLPSGILPLTVPGALAGEIAPVIELTHPQNGERLSGAFTLRVDRQATSPLHFHAGGDAVEGGGAVYKPIEFHGLASNPTPVLGAKVKLTVPLVRQLPARAVPLGRLCRRERIVDISTSAAAEIRVLQVCVDPVLVIGRCHVSQLEFKAQVEGDEVAARALERLRGTGTDRVGWVVAWDGGGVPRIVASCRTAAGSAGPGVEITSVTDYEARPTPVVVETTSSRQVIESGAPKHLTLDGEPEWRLRVGESSGSAEVCRVMCDEAQIGDAWIPFLRTRSVRFSQIDKSTLGNVEIRFLGVWIPLPRTRLASLLRLSRDPLAITFAEEDDTFSLWLSWDERADDVMVSSNYDLRSALERCRG